MNEYVNNLLREECNKYYPSNILRRRSLYGNDKYGHLYNIKQTTVKEIEEVIADLKDRGYDGTPKMQEAKDMLDSVSRFGYDFIYDKDDTRYPLLMSHHENLNKRFLIKYYNYRMAYNTHQMFNYKLYEIFEDIAPDYENKLRMLELYKKQIFDENNKLNLNLDVDDFAKTDSVSKTFFFNEHEENKKHEAGETESGASTKNTSFQNKIKNISSGYLIDHNVLRDYLNEFRALFICVWSDETGV